MMPVGFVGALELPEDFENIRVPSFDIIGAVNFAGPWDRLESFASLGGLPKLSVILPSEGVDSTYRHVPLKHCFVYN